MSNDKTGYKVSIESKSTTNKNYRKVLHTTEQQQLVLMCLKPDEDIPEEKHPNTTQFIRIEKGSAQITINGKKYNVTDGDAVMIPANTLHYVKNTGKSNLQLYTIYSPPEHPDKLVQKTKPKE